MTGKPATETKHLAIVGAGPKAIAIAAKASVLKRLGFKVPDITIFERGHIAHHWRAESGFTNGKLTLGTGPDKDVGFPYYSFCWGDAANRKINYLIQEFSWQNYLIATHEFGDWVDRGKPAPTHHHWARYLEWVFKRVEKNVTLVQANLSEAEVQGDHWKLTSVDKSGQKTETLADGLVFTGPGEPRFSGGSLPVHERILRMETFWLRYKEYTSLEKASVALVGTGETAATIAVAMAQSSPNVRVDIISPSAMAYSRGESYVENHIYTDPFQGNWLHLTREDRRNFINRTDRGVFSISTKQEMDRLKNIEIVPGLFTGITVDSLDQLVVNIAYNSGSETRLYDMLILSVGFDHLEFVKRVLTKKAQDHLVSKAALPDLSTPNVEDKIDRYLAVDGMRPYLHLPMLAGMSQGPGFANLSCLGRLSDHILSRYVPPQSALLAEHPILRGVNDFSSHDGF